MFFVAGARLDAPREVMDVGLEVVSNSWQCQPPSGGPMMLKGELGLERLQDAKQGIGK